MTCGEEAVTYLQKGIEIMTREQSKKKDLTNTSKSSVELSRAYCSLAEIYLTDEWYIRVGNFIAELKLMRCYY